MRVSISYLLGGARRRAAPRGIRRDHRTGHGVDFSRDQGEAEAMVVPVARPPEAKTRDGRAKLRARSRAVVALLGVIADLVTHCVSRPRCNARSASVRAYGRGNMGDGLCEHAEAWSIRVGVGRWMPQQLVVCARVAGVAVCAWLGREHYHHHREVVTWRESVLTFWPPDACS